MNIFLTKYHNLCNIVTTTRNLSQIEEQANEKTNTARSRQKLPASNIATYDEIIKFDGFDAICAFSELLGGSSVYVPSTRTIFSACLYAQAKKELDSTGASLAKLSREYGFSEKQLRKMLLPP